MYKTYANKTNKTPFNPTSSAFTIIELLIVIVIIGILVAIVATSYNGITNNAHKTSVLSTASQAGKKLVTTSMTKPEGLPVDKASVLAMVDIKETDTKTIQYTKNTSAQPNNFCLTVSEGNLSAHITGDSTGTLNQAIEGPCNDHTAPAPDLSYLNCPTGFIPVPGSSYFNQPSFCVMKYEAKIKDNDNGQTAYSASMIPESRASGTPWGYINQDQAREASKRLGQGYSLITESQWLAIAHNVLNQPTNWSTGTVGDGYIYSGHNDGSPAMTLAASTNDSQVYIGTGNSNGNQRRTLRLSNSVVIWDISGNTLEWTDTWVEGSGSQPAPIGTGYVFRQLNDSLNRKGSLVDDPFPSYASPVAAQWGSAQGLGTVYASGSQSAKKAVFRGGYWDSKDLSGPFSLALDRAPDTTGASLGFRVSYMP